MASEQTPSESKARSGHLASYSASVHSRISLSRTPNSSHQKPTRLTARDIQRHPTQHSVTLNRKSVKKEIIAQKPTLKRSHNIVAHPTMSVPVNSRIKLSSAIIDPGRAKRAHDILRSTAVKKFTKPSARTNATPVKTLNDVTRVVDIKPIRQPEVELSLTSKSQVISPVSQTVIPSQFNKLINETEEEKPHRYLEYTPVKKRRGLSRFSARGRRFLAYGAACFAVVLLTGFAFASNKNNIELKIADIRAGINATIPAYTPSNFAISGFKHQPGQVAISYNSEQDGHGFSLSQSFSDLDSNSLAVLLSNKWKSYDTLNAAGRTVFNRTDSQNINATWVSNGLQYQITGNASLSKQQIIKIASST